MFFIRIGWSASVATALNCNKLRSLRSLLQEPENFTEILYLLTFLIGAAQAGSRYYGHEITLPFPHEFQVNPWA